LRFGFWGDDWKEHALPKLIFLGTSAAVPDLAHENAHMVVVSQNHTLLIDSGSNPYLRLQQAGLNPLQVTDILVTHFHPDHSSGVPSFMMSSWLSGRKNSLDLHGLSFTLERVERNLELYDWASWPNFYPVRFRPVEKSDLVIAIDSDDLRLLTSPVCHMIPAIGLRIESPQSGRSIAYSCDTEPCEAVVRLAAGAHILIHEATGEGLGHSSAAQAGEIAQRAGVEILYLIHYPTGRFDPTPLIREARQGFSGQVLLAQDFLEIEF
jgi:ribonuclease Z